MGLVDTAVILVTGTLIYFVLVYLPPSSWPIYAAAMALNAAAAITAFHHLGAYRMHAITQPLTCLAKLVFAYTIIFFICLVLAFSLKISADFSRVWMFSWFFLATVFLWSARILIGNSLVKLGENGHLTRNIVIVGAGDHGKRLIEELQRKSDPWIRLVGIFDDRKERSPKKIGDVPVIGSLVELSEFLKRYVVDDVLVALPMSAENRLIDIFNGLQVFPVDVSLCPDFIGYSLNGGGSRHIGGIAFSAVSGAPISGWSHVVKILEDRVLAFLFLLIWMPVMLVIAGAIKIDSQGPVFFHQTRRGFNRQEANILKFRTMHADACTAESVPQATHNDPRVTRVGAVLRRYSLDELPQFLNVLRGDMSIVGPRPHPINLDDKFSKFIDMYLGRHKVKPGITGWAQVNGYRGETETVEKMERRLDHDLFYIQNWSLLFDLWIILRTPAAMVSGKNAH